MSYILTNLTSLAIGFGAGVFVCIGVPGITRWVMRQIGGLRKKTGL